MTTTSILQAHRRRGWRAACVGAWLAASAAAALQHEDGAVRLERSATSSQRRRLLGCGSGSSSGSELAARFSHSPTKRPAAVATAAASELSPHFNAARWLQPAAAPSTTTTATSATPLRTKTIQHEYELQRVVGEGGFGLVHAARHRTTGSPVALKRVFKAGTTREKFLQEVAVLRHVSSGTGAGAGGVLQLRDAFETADAYVLVTELVAGGELFDVLAAHGALSERRAGSLTRELAAALAFLHAKRVVHGDVKPENILLVDDADADAGAGDASSMRLVDFGQAFREDKVLERVRSVGTGTAAYAAPEVLSCAGEVSAAADMWALGVVLYMMLCGRHPFDPTNEASDDEIAARICDGAFAQSESVEWADASPAARDLVQQLLVVDPSARLTAEQVLQHEWLTGGGRATAA